MEISGRQLSSSDFGFDFNSNSFQLTNKYLWSNYEVQIPAKIDFTFTFDIEGDSEFHPCFSKDCNGWGGANSTDALSWFMATHRQDFTFRTGMFEGFPKTKRPHNGFKCETNRAYKMSCTIEPTTAKYYIDGELYAEAFFESKDIP